MTIRSSRFIVALVVSLVSATLLAGCSDGPAGTGETPPLSVSVDGEVADIMAFLRSLTDPGASGLAATIPARVPSGLPVDD